MKILLMNNDRRWSGGQEHLKDLARGLRSRDHEIHFVVRSGSVSDRRFRDLGYPVHSLPEHGPGDVVSFLRLARLFLVEQFDIISINREHDLFLSALAWKIVRPFLRHGRFMMSYHTATTRKQLLLGAVDAVVCISEHVRNQLLKSNPAAAPITRILYYGIEVGDPPSETKYMVDRPRRFFTGRPFPIIGMVGEFWKNQIDLVRMIPRLRQAYPSITVAFIGDDSDPGLVAPLRDEIKRLGVGESVIFTGRVPRERIPDIFHDFDLSVTTHRNEGFGIVHLESLAAGTPVIGYDEGGYVDIFRGNDTGVLVNGGIDCFAEEIVRILADDARRFSMGKSGAELVRRKYSLDAMVRNYIDFYGSLLRGEN